MNQNTIMIIGLLIAVAVCGSVVSAAGGFYLYKKKPAEDTEPSVDCALSEWSAFGDCIDGKKSRSKTIKNIATGGGKGCDGPSEESKDCTASIANSTANSTANDTNTNTDTVNDTANSPVDCVLSEWSNFGDCMDGSKSRSRTIKTPASMGGKECGSLLENKICAVDCQTGNWSGWSGCDSSGKQSRTRKETTQQLNGGSACGPLREEQNCKVDCQTGNWSGWTCDKKTGKQTRTRQVTKKELNGGSCGSLKEQQNCNVDCETSGWGGWSDCDSSGYQKRTRKTTVPKKNNGKDCVLEEKKRCIHTYGRGAGRMPDKAGCPSGMRDDGTSCWADAYGRGSGYGWWNWKSGQTRCEDAKGRGNCESWGLLWYPKCKSGYKNSACCICSPNGGAGIKRTLFQRQSCRSNEDKYGGLCYPKCKTGYSATGCCVCTRNG